MASIIDKVLKKTGARSSVSEKASQEEGVDDENVNFEKKIEKSLRDKKSTDGTVDESHITRPASVKLNSDGIVSINWTRLYEQGFLNSSDSSVGIAEEFRLIKRHLINNIKNSRTNGIKRPNLIMIGSSLSGEGKTFISINLALSIANERDKKVLLIDADVEKPSISKCLGIKQSPGLIEYLESDELEFDDLVVRTDQNNLCIVPAGRRHKYSTELLSSDKMQKLLDDLSEQDPNRIVIFDSSPILLATQSHVLAELVGQVILVIAADSTPQNAVNDAVAILENCDVLMTLLNKTKRAPSAYGGYDYYGSYGYGR